MKRNAVSQCKYSVLCYTYSNKTPPHICVFLVQIAVKNGVVQSWGLVEYKGREEAEAVVESLAGEHIRGQPFRKQTQT